MSHDDTTNGPKLWQKLGVVLLLCLAVTPVGMLVAATVGLLMLAWSLIFVD